MMKTKLMSTLLVALLVVSATGITASAVEKEAPSTPTAPCIQFDKEAKQAALEEKGIAFASSMSAMEEKMLAKGKTTDEIAAMQGKFTEKFEELKTEKAATIMANKENRGTKTITKSATMGARTQTVTGVV